MLNVERRFWSKVGKGSDCWEWQGSLSRGYGKFYYQGKPVYAHRFSFELAHGRSPQGVVRHSCDNRGCVNPSHLLEGSQKENLRDMVDRDRHTRGERQPTSKLTADQVLEIRKRRASGEQGRALAKEFGVSEVTISNIHTRTRWSDERNFTKGSVYEATYDRY